MEMETAIVLAANSPIIIKLFGPTAEYLGDNLKNWTEKSHENTRKIISSAIKKVENLDDGKQVPPRALKNILTEGSYCEDPLATEYFGGVLASSRSINGRDDRGVVWSSLLGQLSTYQLRTHYIIYQAMINTFHGKDYTFNMEDRPKMSILIPSSAYHSAMEFSDEELKQVIQILTQTFFGLYKEGLIEKFYYGPNVELQKKVKIEKLPFTESGIYITPSALGVELFLWVHGFGQFNIGDTLFLDFPELNGAPPMPISFSEQELKDNT